MGLSLTLAMLAAGVFLLWVGLTGRHPLAELTSILSTGQPTPKAATK